MLSRRNLALPGASTPLQIPLYMLMAAVANAQGTTTNAQNTQATQTTQNTQQTQTQATATRTQNTQTQNTNTQATSVSQISVTDLPDINASTSTTAVSSISISDAPLLSTNTATGTNSQFLLTGSAPVIAGVGIPTQVVPYTANAPFMRKSNMPSGTVFIVVGAILGFLGACVLLWRGMIAWQLHRSVRKQDSTLYGGLANDSGKLLHKPKKSGTYNMATFSSNGSSENAGSRNVSRTKPSARGPSLSLATPGAARQSSLFFSPTAGAGSHINIGNSMNGPASRSSTYMPAGYYSSPSATVPAGGAYSTNIGGAAIGSTSSLAHLNPLGPARSGYAPASTMQSSPPGSPAIIPRYSSTDGMRHKYNAATPASYQSRVPSSVGTPVYGYGHSPSTSTTHLNLNAPGGTTHGGRAPSANLEELFDQRR